jgi:hypothetical protein
MRRSATLPREGARASTTGIGPAPPKALSSSRKASAQAFSAHSPFDSAAVKPLRSMNYCSASVIRRRYFMQ